MQISHIILSAFLTLSFLGLNAQGNDLQAVKDKVDGIIKGADAKDKKQEKVIEAIRSYTSQFDGYHEDGPLKGQPLLNKEQVDEIISILKGADAQIDPDLPEAKPKSRGVNQTKSLNQCFKDAWLYCPGCTTLVPGYVFIWDDPAWPYEYRSPCLVFEYHAEFINVVQSY